MKKEKLVKILLITIMMVVLLGMSINVFAATTLDDSDVIDITNSVVTNNTNSSISLNTNTGNTYNTNINTNKGNVNNTNLPNTGIAENTIFVISVIVLGIVAIYAYRKINYYKNI